MHIGIICYPTYGGSGIMATELGISLAKKGHKIHFINYQQPVRLSFWQENIFYHEIPLITYPVFDYLPYETMFTSCLVDIAINHQLDILHVHYAIPHAMIAINAKKILEQKNIKIKVVTTLHGTDITLVGNQSSFAPVVTYSINESDYVTAVSQYLKKATEELFVIKKSIEVIPNFIDVKRYKKNTSSAFRKKFAQPHEKIILHLSNFRKIKCIPDIIAAFHRIIKKIPSKLLLLGDGPERLDIERMVQELHVEDNIVFLGKQDQIEQLLSIGDLFFLVSENESFGLAALEAMAAGIPIITTNVGGMPEIQIHGYSGFSCALHDIDSMVNYAIDLLSNKQMLEQFKKQAKKQAKKFNVTNILPLYENIYHRCLS